MTEPNYAQIAADAGLRRISGRMPFWKYLKETWHRRGFALSLARFRLDAEFGNNRLGIAWVVGRPILNVIVYGSVFGLILSSSSRPENFIPYLVVGVFIFEYFNKALQGGASAIIGNRGIVRSLTFPRLLLPFSLIIQRTFEMVPVMVVMFIVVAAFGEPITWSWLMVAPIMALMMIFNFGVAMIAARLTVHFRDVQQLIPFIARIVFYSSGIFYSLDKVLASKPQLLALVPYSPVSDYINLVRNAVVTGVEVSTTVWVVAIAAAFVTFAFGLVFFWQAEERYGDE